MMRTEQQNNISVSIDPRVELINALQYHTGENNRLTDILISEPSEYKSSLLDFYGKINHHPVSVVFTKMARNGFSYDAPHVFTLSHSWPIFESSSQLSEDIIERASGLDQLNKFRVILGDFMSGLDYEGFCNQWQEWYDSISDPVISHLSNSNLINHLNGYYQEYHRKYSVVLSPLMRGGYSIPLPDDQIITLLGINWIQQDVNDYSRLNEYLLHEFSHSFINPLADQYEKEVSELSGLFSPIQQIMKSYAYTDWTICLNEHIVRAVTVRIHDLMGNQSFSESMRAEHLDDGFIYLDHILEVLKIYETNLHEYATFQDFYPTILNSLGEF